MPSRGDPIIFDDGGSTRIMKSVADDDEALDGLLDVDTNANPPQSSARVEGPFSQLSGVSVDYSGVPNQFVNTALIEGDYFTIVSDNGQSVYGAIDGNGRCKITVKGSTGNPPMVEAKQFKKMRRYFVGNAGPILSVDGVANGAAFHFQAPVNATYTSLIVS